MKLADLLNTLSEYDPETDVVVALRPEGDYRDFAIKDCQGISLQREGRNMLRRAFERGGRGGLARVRLQRAFQPRHHLARPFPAAGLIR